ncbi:hypothetical protein E2C01_018936 [Portunus trituberculatus]|uniref:Uncharacterized protein n=1 Tax=Portunus trituberculatus TaxID=210409 RepID=A0A5B7DXX3_PORTR|nr:hypothetical protein [Portunus trituberculatus]
MQRRLLWCAVASGGVSEGEQLPLPAALVTLSDEGKACWCCLPGCDILSPLEPRPISSPAGVVYEPWRQCEDRVSNLPPNICLDELTDTKRCYNDVRRETNVTRYQRIPLLPTRNKK